ncbi:chromatin remodeling protein EBS-like [Andrographis paniculata]|uniref:chromatin remodeling protein EBS-like n=1 Tax=Andrographis paniculata TaxID=175694 RepID=UPI0021E73EFB|nr:chromatin remodeling protein EBS-like [Andrographis paniculata]XP_051145430.1 chromatin remodeling protein EBS-like [Andrographis paniculata]
MPMPKRAPRTLDAYVVRQLDDSIRPGDCVWFTPMDEGIPPHVARIEMIVADGENVKIHVRWYYRPEESYGGRRKFHGSKELFLSEHREVVGVNAIEGKCRVHSIDNYTSLDVVRTEDYFCRFEYNSTTGAFTPDSIIVFCSCEMPFNPDFLMVQCELCTEWFHPECLGTTLEEVRTFDHLYCDLCDQQ